MYKFDLKITGDLGFEFWKDIPDFEGLYQVSTYGRVKILERKYNCGHGHIQTNHMRECIKKGSKGKDYYQVLLSKFGKKRVCKKVHRIVYETFKGRILEGMQVNHIDENKLNNRVENLNLMTPKENNNWGTSKKRRSIKMKNRKDMSKPVYQIKDGIIINRFDSIHEAGRVTGIPFGNISHCCNGDIKKNKNGYKYVVKSAGGYKWEYA